MGIIFLLFTFYFLLFTFYFLVLKTSLQTEVQNFLVRLEAAPIFDTSVLNNDRGLLVTQMQGFWAILPSYLAPEYTSLI